LAAFSVVSVEVRLRGLAGGAGAVFRNIALRASPDGLYRFAVSPGVIAVEILPVPVLMVADDLRELIHLEFLVFWGMGVVKGPLPEGDIFADKHKKPAVILVKSCHIIKKILYNVHEHCLLCIVKVWSLTLYQKGRSMLFLFESPLESRFLNIKQVVNLTLPFDARRNEDE
jgi:hypothetical protein